MASLAATLILMPGGLGTFETACVAMLTLLRVPVEAALAATLLQRGLTYWLPMLPGLWLSRREIRSESKPTLRGGRLPGAHPSHGVPHLTSEGVPRRMPLREHEGQEETRSWPHP